MKWQDCQCFQFASEHQIDSPWLRDTLTREVKKINHSEVEQLDYPLTCPDSDHFVNGWNCIYNVWSAALRFKTSTWITGAPKEAVCKPKAGWLKEWTPTPNDNVRWGHLFGGSIWELPSRFSVCFRSRLLMPAWAVLIGFQLMQTSGAATYYPWIRL